ncbi:MAG: hypothetical protein WAZ18_01795 [Alphaproteobacteria bacterium]
MKLGFAAATILTAATLAGCGTKPKNPDVVMGVKECTLGDTRLPWFNSTCWGEKPSSRATASTAISAVEITLQRLQIPVDVKGKNTCDLASEAAEFLDNFAYQQSQQGPISISVRQAIQTGLNELDKAAAADGCTRN